MEKVTLKRFAIGLRKKKYIGRKYGSSMANSTHTTSSSFHFFTIFGFFFQFLPKRHNKLLLKKDVFLKRLFQESYLLAPNN